MEVNDGEEKVEIGSGLCPDWSELTRECLLDIFSRLSQEQRWSGPMLVSKNWMNACYDPSLNTIFDLETRFLSFPESINWWTPEFEDKVDSFFRSVVDRSEGGLTEIRIRHCTDRSLSYAAERYDSMEVNRRVVIEMIQMFANIKVLLLSDLVVHNRIHVMWFPFAGALTLRYFGLRAPQMLQMHHWRR